MAACKCRYCQKNMKTNDAYMSIVGRKRAYFCNEEHYDLFMKDKKEKDRREKEALEAAKKQREAREVASQKYQENKDRAYYLICDIIGRKQISNTVLWSEWAIWNKVADNKAIGQYLEENKDYLCRMVSKLANNEFLRIRYLSAILKNNLGAYHTTAISNDAPQIKVQVDETFYEPTPSTQTKRKKRRSLDDLEDEF